MIVLPKPVIPAVCLTILVSLACGIGAGTPQVNTDAAATAVAQTMQALPGSKNPNAPVGLVPATVTLQGMAQPTPTNLPTKAPPTQSANQPAAPVSQKLTISNVVPYPSNVVYFGNCIAGEITLLNVQATIEPLNQVKSAVLWYNLVNFSGRPKSSQSQMFQLGIGDYAGDINLSVEAPAHLGAKDGMVEFWIEAADKSGAVVRSNTYSVSVYYCQPPAIPTPQIIYFNARQNVSPGDWVHLEWSTQNAGTCGVTLDGNFVDAAGSYDYQVTDAQAGTTITHTLRAFGEPCDNPIIASEQRTITVGASSGQQASPRVVAERYQAVIVEDGGRQWDLDTASNTSGELELSRNTSGGPLLLKLGSKISAWNYLPAGPQDCRTAVTQAGWSELTVGGGQYICYSTDAGNIGYMYIESIVLTTANKYEMTFTFITWAGP